MQTSTIHSHLHHLHHHLKTAGDAGITTRNHSDETVSATASPASPASPLKTDLGSSISEKTLKVDNEEYGEADMLSIAQTLESVAAMPEPQAKETLKELYGVWKSVDMQKASAQLKTMNPKAFDVLRKLVAALKLSGDLEVAN